jgi:hypothetical protein
MIRKVKIIGMALVALFALSAVGASAAQAASSLDVGATPAFVTADQIAGNPLKLALKTATGGTTLSTVKCTTGHLETTTTTANVTEATLTPSYAGCTLGGLEAEVKVNGCKYTLTNTAVAKTAEVDITSCTTPLEIVQAGCVIKIANQGPLGSITFANLAGPPKDVEATVAVSMIAWSGGAGCPANLANVNGTDAELNGPTTVRAFNDASGVEGSQVSLEAT